MTIRSQRMFWNQFIENYAAVGALLPSSRALGQAGAAYLGHPRSTPIRVLEAGAGTGSFTCEAIPLLRPGDRLTWSRSTRR
ncbi:MAG: hypothetical protein HC802_05825 [Caldilineaceae bacterium]|nr:hypothetical protein [Caldilineaceae bacterium]